VAVLLAESWVAAGLRGRLARDPSGPAAGVRVRGLHGTGPATGAALRHRRSRPRDVRGVRRALRGDPRGAGAHARAAALARAPGAVARRAVARQRAGRGGAGTQPRALTGRRAPPRRTPRCWRARPPVGP